MKINTKELKDRGKKIIAQFDKDAIIFLVLLLAILFFCISKFIAPNVSEVFTKSKQLFEKNSSVSSMKKEIKIQQELQKKKHSTKTKEEVPVKIYKAPFKDIELESAAASLVNNIILIIKASGPNKIIAINFEKKPLKDNMGIESKKHSILSMKLEMESSYDTIQSILNEIYLMDYLVRIQTVSLNAMQKYNYKRVESFIILDLFVDVS